MQHPFFEFFNKNRPPISSDSSKWPREWKIVKWKSYPSHQKIDLPKPEMPESSLKNSLLNRQSYRDFSDKTVLPSLKELSTLLFYSCGLTKPNKDLNSSRRPHPSGGGLYPLEIYLLIFKPSKEIASGLYHYDIRNHRLEKLSERNVEELKQAFHYPWAADASMMILFSFTESRGKPKYGNLAYKVGLIEAGHIGQNFYLNCAALKLKCCALGGLDEDKIHRALDLDGFGETVFYVIAVGK